MSEPTSDRRAIRLQALATGSVAEVRVQRALEARGWVLLVRNWRGGGGEIDLILERGGQLRFVEVKARREDDPLGIDAVDSRKQARLKLAARAWLALHPTEADDIAFLIAWVDPSTEPWVIRWLDNPFDE